MTVLEKSRTLLIQGDNLQEVGRNFSLTIGRDDGETSATVNPLLVHAMENTKMASLGSLHLL